MGVYVQAGECSQKYSEANLSHECGYLYIPDSGPWDGDYLVVQ